MKEEFIERWLDLSAKNETDLYTKMLTKFPKTVDGKVDIRGFPFTKPNQRANLENIIFNNADLSFCDFSNCNLFNMKFINCIFENTIFNEIRQWNIKYQNALFKNCQFNNGTLGRDTIYENCDFLKSKLIGKYFSFGNITKYINCSFNECKIQSADITSITFDKCIFRSTFKSVRFSSFISSKLEIDAYNRNYATTVIDTNFEESLFIQVEIFDGVILKNVKWPKQNHERFNNDRIYYG